MLYAIHNSLKNSRRANVENVDFYIDGFWRCGNSFFSDAVRLRNPDLKVMSHCHSPKTIEAAVMQKINTVILIREPIDAVVSFSLFSGFSLTSAFLLYIWF